MRLEVLAASLLVVSALTAPVFAQDPVDLTAVNLEDLLKMEVRSVSKKEQQLFRTAAAVYVLTNEEIRRSGVSLLPEALRLVPGLQVARVDGSNWAVSARGFNGLWANKLLVLVDGRVVYTPVSSGVYWGLQDLPLEEIERIEVVRGPGATVWGANAVNGVINIITRSAERAQGGIATFRTGSPDQAVMSARYGGAIGSSGFYRVYAKHAQRSALVDDTGAAASDDSRLTQVGFGVDLNASDVDAWTFQGAIVDGESGQRIDEPLTSYTPTPRTIIASDAPVQSQFLLARWNRSRSARSGLSFQMFWDHNYRAVIGNGETTHTIDLEFQHRFPVGRRHDLVWGMGQRFWSDEEGGQFAQYFDPTSSRIRLFNAFVQDEIALTPTVNLTAGSKIEHYSIAGFEAQPTVRVAWLPSARQTVWAAASRAARTPSRVERAVHVDNAVVSDDEGNLIVISVRGNPEVENEHTMAVEAGYRIETASTLLIDIAAFHNRYRDLIGTRDRTAFEPTPAPPHVTMIQEHANGVTGESHGVEVLTRWQPTPRWRLDASYDWLRLRLRDFQPLQSDVVTLTSRHPEHQWRLKSWLNLTRGWQIDAMLLYTGKLETVDVPHYLRADLRLGGPIRSNVDVSIVGQNLLKATHREFDGFEGLYFSQVRRGGSVQATVKF